MEAHQNRRLYIAIKTPRCIMQEKFETYFAGKKVYTGPEVECGSKKSRDLTPHKSAGEPG